MMAKIEWIENADGTITVTHEGHTASFKREEWMSDDEVFERAKWELIAIGASLKRDTITDLVLPSDNGGGDTMAKATTSQALAQAATSKATNRLRETYADEYKRLVKEERVSRGLSPEPPAKKVTVDQKIDKLQKRLNALIKEREAERNQ
jgi:phosphoglycolate phosphatase-like HAD superfamily hydrolase